MIDHFFNSFADEILKLAGPTDWFLRSVAKVDPKTGQRIQAPGKTVKQVTLPKSKPALVGESQRKELKREGVFGM